MISQSATSAADLAGKYPVARAELPPHPRQPTGGYGWGELVVPPLEREGLRRGQTRAEKPQGVAEPGESERGERHTGGRTKEGQRGTQGSGHQVPLRLPWARISREENKES